MAERAFIDSQVDKFLKDLVKIYDNNKDDERRKFKDLSTRYDDVICKKVNDQAPSTIFEMLRNPAGGASTPVDPTIQFKPGMFTPQAKPGHLASQGFMSQHQHGDPLGSNMSGFYQQQQHHQQSQHGYPQQQQHHHQQHQPQHGNGRFQFDPSFPPRMNHRHGGNEPNMDFMPMGGNPNDSLLGDRPSARHHSPMQQHHQMHTPLGQIPTAYSSIENFHQQSHDGRLGRSNFNFPVPPQNPSKPISQEDILKRNIQLLGGLEPSLDFMEGSLKENELRHYNVNSAHAARHGNGRDVSPGGTRIRLDSASPLRNTYHQESDYTPYMNQGHAPPRFGTGQLPMPQHGHGGHGGHGQQQQFAGYY